MSFAEFNNIRTLRKEAREIGYDVFLEIAEKVLAISSEIEDLKKEDEANRAKKLALIEKFQAMLAEEGIEGIAITEIAEGVVAPAKTGSGSGKGGKGVKRGSVEPKYAFKDDKGVEQNWSGRGRMPLPLKAKIEAGEKLESFLIKKED